jgi:hypothetical protein
MNSDSTFEKHARRIHTSLLAGVSTRGLERARSLRETGMTDTTFERHYSISELRTLWGLGRETTRKLVKDEPGVVKICMGRKQSNTSYSIPESVAVRIHTRLTNAA